VKYFKIVCVVIVFSLAPKMGYAESIESVYQRGSRIYHQIKKGKLNNTHANWDRAIQSFQQVITKVKFQHSRWVDAMFSLGLCYIETENYLRAVNSFRELIKRVPNHRLSDDAQYLIGYSFQKRNDSSQSMLEFERVIFRYPSGDMYKKALLELESMYADLKDTTRQQEMYKFVFDSIDDSYLKYKYRQKIEELSQPKVIADSTVIDSNSPSQPIVSGRPRFLQEKISSSQNSSRLVIEFDQPIEYKYNYLVDRKILYVDFIDGVAPSGLIEKKINNGIIEQFKIGQFNPQTMRLSIYLVDSCHYHLFMLDNPTRLVIDFSKPIYIDPELMRQKPADLTLVNQLSLKVSTIIIDAGHGGKDPGTSFGRNYEKDIVLTIAKKLQQRLNKEPEFQAILTRDDDIFFALEERTEIANSMNGDLFISLHLNSAPKSEASGIETFYLSLTHDAWSQQLAARENATTLLKITDLNNLLNQILIDSKIRESAQFAQTLHNQLVKKTKTTDRGIKKAPFIVLIGANMPSILVELGFITNKKERSQLLNKKYQDQLADALFLGIQQYAESLKSGNY